MAHRTQLTSVLWVVGEGGGVVCVHKAVYFKLFEIGNFVMAT